MSTSLSALATMVSRKRGDLEEVQTSAGGTTTSVVVDTLVIGGDNEYAGDELLFPDRTGAPRRRVTSSTIADYTLNFAPALPTATAEGEAVEKRKRHLYADVVAAINAAITDIAPVFAVLAPADTSITLQSGVYEYTIPASFIYVCQVEVWDGDGYEAAEPLQWDTRPGGKLWIAENIVDSYSGSAVRLTGYEAATTLALREAATDVPAPYILAFCDWYLSGQREGTDPRLLSSLYQTKEFERQRAASQYLPNVKGVKP